MKKLWKAFLRDGKTEIVSDDVIGAYTIRNIGKIEKMELIKN